MINLDIIIWVYILKQKSEVFERFLEWKAMVKTLILMGEAASDNHMVVSTPQCSFKIISQKMTSSMSNGTKIA